MLEDRGYRVSCVPDGASMRHLLENGGVDGIIIDGSMRGETSTSLAEHAKALRLPLVMISGNDAVMAYADDHHLHSFISPSGFMNFATRLIGRSPAASLDSGTPCRFRGVISSGHGAAIPTAIRHTPIGTRIRFALTLRPAVGPASAVQFDLRLWPPAIARSRFVLIA